MSHGGGGEGGDTSNRDLIPLLDLVLQLVMFFMVTAQFVVEDLQSAFVLPESAQAQVADRPKNDITLEVDKEGAYSMTTPAEGGNKRVSEPLNDNAGKGDPIKAYTKLDQRYKQELEAGKGDQSAAVHASLILETDRRAPYKAVYELLKAAKDAGYNDILVLSKIPEKGAAPGK